MFGRTPPIWVPASSAAAVAGLNPYKSAAEAFVAVWRSSDPQGFSVCRAGLGAAGCTTAAEILALGEAAVDPAVWAKALKSTANCRAGCAGEAGTMARALPGKTITDCNADMMIWRDPGKPFAFRGYVDGICEGRVVEAKTRASSRIFGRAQPPTYDVVQCHVYMAMTGTTEATFVEAHGDQTKVTPIPFDAALWERVLAACDRFARAVRRVIETWTDDEKRALLRDREAGFSKAMLDHAGRPQEEGDAPDARPHASGGAGEIG